MRITVLSQTPLATVATFAHGPGPHVDPEEEVFARPLVIFTTHGTWGYRGSRTRAEVTETDVVIGHPGESYSCSHASEHPDDRTLFVLFDHERLGYDPLPARGLAGRTRVLAGLGRALGSARAPLEVDALALRLAVLLRGEPHRRPAPRHAAVAEAVEILDASVETGISLLELGRAMHVSPYHLHRVFRDQVGLTPHAYLTRRRVEAAQLLLEGGATVLEAATAVGLSSPGHLAVLFRRHTGVTPSAYRRPAGSPGG